MLSLFIKDMKIYIDNTYYMDRNIIIDALIKAGTYSPQDKQTFLGQTSKMTSMQEIFKFLLSNVGDSIDEKNDFVKEIGQNEEIRKVLKPQIQFWLLKIKIAEIFGAEVNDEDVLETIDSSLRE